MTSTSARIDFRPLRHSELPEYGKLLLRAVGELERATGLDQGGDSLAVALARWPVWLSLAFLRRIGRPFLEAYVAADGPRLVGTGTVVMFPRAGYVVGMATEPEYRGQGIASRILEHLATVVRRGHREWIALDVEPENETALRVYRRAGYREVARFAWFRRPGLPTTNSPTVVPLPPASKQETEELLPRLDAHQSPEYRTALPATLRMLTHNEIIFQGGRFEHRTWVGREASGAPVGIRAYFFPATQMGVLFPLTTGPETAALTSLFDQATEWLRPNRPVSCLAIAPEADATTAQALRRIGFTVVVSSTTMVSSVRPGPAGGSRKSPTTGPGSPVP